MSDARLWFRDWNSDLIVSQGDVAVDDGLEPAVIVSLFTDAWPSPSSGATTRYSQVPFPLHVSPPYNRTSPVPLLTEGKSLSPLFGASMVNQDSRNLRSRIVMGSGFSAYAAPDNVDGFEGKIYEIQP